MANPGIGYAKAYRLLMQISLHLVSQVAYTTLSAAVTPSLQLVTLAATANLIAGNQVVIDPGLPTEEIVYLSTVTATQIQALFAQPHAAGAVLLGACFPEQANTDPFYTQQEVMGYISRAQNEFLSRVPCYFALFYSQINFGQILQALPCTPIELIRVAFSPTNVAIASLIRTANVVTVITQSPHNLVANEKFSIINAPLGLANSSFNGAFKVSAIASPTQFTFAQHSIDDSSGAGGTVSLWTRLKEVTQEMLTLTTPGWQGQYRSFPSAFYEDRTGLYTYGVDGRPSSNFPSEVLCSIRDTDSLALGDGFLVPDIMLHYVKYRALQFCWEKDGEARNPMLAQYCATRFERGVLASLRWLDAMLGMQESSSIKQQAAKRSRG